MPTKPQIFAVKPFEGSFWISVCVCFLSLTNAWGEYCIEERLILALGIPWFWSMVTMVTWLRCLWPLMGQKVIVESISWSTAAQLMAARMGRDWEQRNSRKIATPSDLLPPTRSYLLGQPHLLLMVHSAVNLSMDEPLMKSEPPWSILFWRKELWGGAFIIQAIRAHGDDSVGKVFSMQAWGLELDPRCLFKKK